MTIRDEAGNETLPPERCGIIEFSVRDKQFGRLNGTCNIVLIEKTASMRKYFKDFIPTRAMKWMNELGDEFNVRWLRCHSYDEVKNRYKQRLWKYIEEHWEQPSGHRASGTNPGKVRRGLRELEPMLGNNTDDDWSDWYEYSDVNKFDSKFVPPTNPQQPPGSWSNWYPFVKGGQIEDLAPKNSHGIYEIRLYRDFERLRGNTNVLNIGVAENSSIHERLINQKLKNPKRYWSGTMLWLKEQDSELALEARWFPLEGFPSESAHLAKQAEDWRIVKFLLEHLEMPPGQPTPPSCWKFLR